MLNLADCLQEPGTSLLQTKDLGRREWELWLFRKPIHVFEPRSGPELRDFLRAAAGHAARGSYLVGFLEYEAGHVFEPAAGPSPRIGRSLGWFGLYDSPTRIEPDALESIAGQSFFVTQPRLDLSKEQYGAAFRRVKQHIREGDVYQINLTGRIRFRLHGSPAALYTAMSRAQQNAYGAYINTGDTFVLSRSPELFFARDGRRIVARPMKGTRRIAPSGEAAEQANVLSADPKSRAENLMITDLLRNDLSIVCEAGSVRTPHLFSIEEHETLLQMTSTVAGMLRDGVDYDDVFSALFPCGSVTGAPKIRARQIIADLETSPRGVYCGAIGWIGPGDRAAFNVAIRTAEIDQQAQFKHGKQAARPRADNNYIRFKFFGHGL